MYHDCLGRVVPGSGEVCQSHADLEAKIGRLKKENETRKRCLIGASDSFAEAEKRIDQITDQRTAAEEAHRDLVSFMDELCQGNDFDSHTQQDLATKWDNYKATAEKSAARG